MVGNKPHVFLDAVAIKLRSLGSVPLCRSGKRMTVKEGVQLLVSPFEHFENLSMRPMIQQ
jgi:hypothetical protein